LICRRADASYDAAVSTRSIEAIWTIWRKRPGSILVPGHDIPMVQKDGTPAYIGERRAGINTWLGDDLETTTLFSLTVA
jgi:N-acyl homoserine lactone hydrolase